MVKSNAVLNNDTAADLMPPSRPANNFPEVTPIVPPINSRRDYVRRRMQLWDYSESGDGNPIHVERGAIAHLPLPLQVAFRRKMLIIFEMQLLFVWIVVGIFRFSPTPKAWADHAFHSIGTVVASFAIALVLLVLLYFIRNQFPFNWGLLILFSIAQSACGVGLEVVVDTYMGFFNCTFTFICVFIMLLLSGVYRNPSPPQQEMSQSTDDAQISVTIVTTQDLTIETENSEGTLLSTFYAGMIAYLIVAILAILAYIMIRSRVGDKFVTQEAFLFSLLFQLALITWFSWDASSMYRVMSPDEYMHGVIYLYTDLILLVIISAVALGTVIVVGAMCENGGGTCAGCYCGGCHDCASPNEQEEGRAVQVAPEIPDI